MTPWGSNDATCGACFVARPGWQFNRLISPPFKVHYFSSCFFQVHYFLQACYAYTIVLTYTIELSYALQPSVLHPVLPALQRMAAAAARWRGGGGGGGGPAAALVMMWYCREWSGSYPRYRPPASSCRSPFVVILNAARAAHALRVPLEYTH
jgi:hypothetical protein